MLTRSYELAVNHGSLLAEKGIGLTAKPNTILSELYSTSRPVGEPVVGSGEVDPVRSYSSILQTDSETHPWGPRFDATVADIAPIVSAQISYIANVVREHVNTFYSAAVEQLEQLKGRDFSVGMYNIEEIRLPGVFENDLMLERLERFRSISPEFDGPLDDVLPSVSVEEILGNISFGNEELNKTIFESLAGIDQAVINACYAQFIGPQNGTAVKRRIDFGTMPFNERFGLSLAMLVILDHLRENPPEGVRHSAVVYKDRIDQSMEYFGAMLIGLVQRYMDRVKSGCIVHTYGKDVVEVYSLSYQEWLKNEGGSPEILFGALVGNKQLYYKHELADHVEALRDLWLQYSGVVERNSKHYIATGMRGTYKILAQSGLNNMDEIEASFRSDNPQSLDIIARLMDERIESFTADELCNPYFVAVEVVAAVRFEHTEAYQYLKDMENSGAEVDHEAALLALTKYIGRFLKHQIYFNDKAGV